MRRRTETFQKDGESCIYKSFKAQKNGEIQNVGEPSSKTLQLHAVYHNLWSYLLR